MDKTRTPLIAGNWKMNGTRADAVAWTAAAALAAADSPNDVALFPPAPWLLDVAEAAGDVAVGAQCCSWEASGAFTGALSATMVRETGATLVLCGHSERRHVFGETDEQVAGSMAQATAAGLTPVLCVGETLPEREAGNTQAVILRQLDAGLGALETGGPLILAYEPVWAIGTGKAATPTEAAQAHGWLRARVAEAAPERAGVRILYGGSVKPDNIVGFLSASDVDGALVGGASLDPDVFGQIIAAGSES